MITITMPKWWAIAMAIWFAMDIIKMLLILVTDAIEKAEQREHRKQIKLQQMLFGNIRRCEMSKYFKAEDVIRAIAEHLCWIARTEYGDKFTTEDWLEEAEDYVSDLPTIDIVRCKDCKWYRNFDGCFFSTAECEPEHFCSWGERIEE